MDHFGTPPEMVPGDHDGHGLRLLGWSQYAPLNAPWALNTRILLLRTLQDLPIGVQNGSKTGHFQGLRGVKTPDPWNLRPSGIAKLVNLRVPRDSVPFHPEFHGISGYNDAL